MTETESLAPADAVALAHALGSTAADAGTRVLFINGPSAEYHGLRDGRVSADADRIASGLMEALIAGKDEDHGSTEEVFARVPGAGDAFGAGCETRSGDEPGVDGEDRRSVGDPSGVA